MTCPVFIARGGEESFLCKTWTLDAVKVIKIAEQFLLPVLCLMFPLSRFLLQNKPPSPSGRNSSELGLTTVGLFLFCVMYM